MSKKINYISHLNGFMLRKVYDLLSPNSTALYMAIFDAFNKSCWNFEWLKIPNRELMYRAGLTNAHTLATSRKYLMDLGYIEFHLVKHGGKIYSAYKINQLDSSGMFIVGGTENPANGDTASVTEFSYDSVDTPVDNVVDNISDRCSTAPHSSPQTAPETSPHSSPQTASETSPHSSPHSSPPIYIKKEKEKEEKKEVKKKEEDGQLQVLCDAYEDYLGRPASIRERQKISAYLTGYGFDAMLAAMEIMIQKKAASIDYCGGILKNMHNDISKQQQEAIADGWELA